MKILITGGTGFIGSHLVHKLVNLDHKIILLKRTNSDIWRIRDVISKCKVYDLDKSFFLDRVFKKNNIKMVIHLATKYIKYENTEEEIKEMIDTNITFPSILLENCRRYNVNFFINTGTCFEYQMSKKKIKENYLKKPFNFYSSTKLAFEEILKYYSYAYKIKSVTLRLFYPYGEKDNEYKLIPTVIKSLIKNKKLKLTKGEQNLDFTYIDDIVEAFLKIILLINNLKENYSIFNIGFGKAVKVKRIIEILQEIHGKKGKIIIGALPYSKNEIMFLESDNSLAKEKLNWHPKYSIEDGLKKTYNFYINNLGLYR